MRVISGVVYVLLLVISIILPNAYASDRPGYILARAPQQSPTTLYKVWSPFASYLSKETGVNIQLKVYASRKEFEEALIKGEPDFVYMNPYYHTISKKKQGYVSLVRSDAKMLKGILVVRRDNPVKSIHDLEHKKLAFPSPNALSASLYPRALLFEQHGVKVEPIYVGTHDNVYRHVFLGKAVAGGGVMRTFLQESPELRDQLRIIYETPGLAPHPLSAHPRVPGALRSRITSATLKLQESEEGRHLLKSLKLQKPVAADFSRDYQVLESLGLHQYGTLK